MSWKVSIHGVRAMKLIESGGSMIQFKFTETVAKETNDRVKALKKELNKHLLEDEGLKLVIAEMRDRMPGVSISEPSDSYKEMEKDWFVTVEFPWQNERKISKWERKIWGKGLREEKELENKRDKVVKEYFGFETRYIDDYRAPKCAATLDFDDILRDKKPEGHIPELLARKYGVQIAEIKAVSRKVVCPYAEECTEPDPYRNQEGDEFVQKGCAACVLRPCPCIKMRLQRCKTDPDQPENETICLKEWWEKTPSSCGKR
jgi:hypothetical protein